MFTQLAADYTGWEGSRTWRSNHFVVDAQFESGGHVAVTWLLEHDYFSEDRWQVRVTTMVEAGEQMANRAADIRALLRPDYEN